MKWTRVVSVIAVALLIAAVILLVNGAADVKSGASNRTEYGKATTYGPGYDGLLALPEGKGHRVKVCSSYSGSRICITKTSNDAGPSLAKQREGKIVDLDIPTFEYLCQCHWRVGVIDVSVEYLSSPNSGQSRTPSPVRPTLPPTDTGG